MLINLLFFSFLVFSKAPSASTEMTRPIYQTNELVSIADSLANIWQWEKALLLYQKANTLFEQQEIWDGYIYTLCKIGEAQKKLGAYERAYETLSMALQRSTEIFGKEHPEVARSHCYLGYYFLSGDGQDLNQSLSEYQLCLKLQKKFFTEKDVTIGKTYMRLGGVYNYLGQIRTSKTNYQEAIGIFENQLDSMNLNLGRSYLYYGMVLFDSHDFERAIEYFLRARRIFEHHPEIDPMERNHVYNNLGNAYFEKEQYEQAVPQYQRAVELIIKSQGNATIDLIPVYGNLAVNYYSLGLDDEARKLFSKIFSIVEKSKVDQSMYYVWANRQFGEFLLERNKPDSAIIYFNNAIFFERKGSQLNDLHMSQLYRLKAQGLLQKEEMDSSRFYIQQSLIHLEDNFNELDVDSNPDILKTTRPDQLYTVLSKKAEILYRSYKVEREIHFLVKAVNLYNQLDLLADIIRNELWSEYSKISVVKYYKRDAGQAIAAISELYAITPSLQLKELTFKFMEKNRYSKIYGNQSRVYQIATSGLPDSLFEFEQRIASDLDRLRNAIRAAKNAKILDSLEREKFELIRIAENFQAEVAANYPGYFSVNYANMLSLSEVQQRLDPNTQIVEYFWADSLIFVLSIDKEEAEIYKVPVNDVLMENIQWFIYRSSLEDQKLIHSERTNTPDEYARVAYRIYRQLLQPFLKMEINRIIISTDGILSFLPFEALTTSDVATSWRSAEYLLHHYYIQQTLSCNLLFGGSLMNEDSEPSILGFAYTDPAVDNDFSKSQVPRSAPLKPIRGSSMELDAIKGIFMDKNHQFLKGPSATESSFKEQVANYNIVHLALHGLGDKDNELNSQLFFRDQAASDNDGRLYAYELYSYDLRNLRLAVLSACQTAFGKEIKGEGIFSMARGFAYAGCASIVMSLWNINDAATADLIGGFYKNLHKSNPIHVALSKAKINYIEKARVDKLAHPYYWAGFVHIGTSDPVRLPNNKGLVWILFIIAFFLSMALIRKWNQRKIE